MKNFLLLFIVEFFPLIGILNAQMQYEYSGQLLEKGTKKILPGVNIYLIQEKNNYKATTDEAGKFVIFALPKGEFQLVVNFSDYQKLETKINIPEKNNEKLYLERLSYTNLFETTVVSRQEKRDDTTRSLTQKEFLNAPGSFGGDPVRAVQNLPGVAQNGASAQIVIQGSSPDDTRYLVNKHEIPLIFHFAGLSSVVLPQAIESVDYLSSGYGADFGRAIGGLVGLNTRKPKNDRYHMQAQIDLFNVGSFIEGPSFLLSARYSYIGYVLEKALAGKEGFNLTVAPVFWDINGLYSKKINEIIDFRLTSIISRDELTFILKKPVNNDPKLRGTFYNRTQFLTFIPEFTFKYNDFRQFDASVGLGGEERLIQFGQQLFDLTSLVMTQRAEWREEFNPQIKTYIGLDNRISSYKIKINAPSVTNSGGVSSSFSTGKQNILSTEGNLNDYAVYIRADLRPTENSPLLLMPMLRTEYYLANKDHIVSPRFNARYQLKNDLMLRAGAGQYYQPPQPQQTAAKVGNPELKSPQAIHYTLGYFKDFRGGQTNGWRLSQGVFYKTLQDLVLPSSKYIFKNGVLTQENYNNKGRGKIIGVESQLNYNLHSLAITAVYTLLHSRRTTPGIGEHPSEFDQTHNLNFMFSYEIGKWNFSSRFRYVTGKPFTPVLDSSFDADFGTFTPIRGPYYANRLGSFAQLDLRVQRQWIYQEWILSAYLDIQNATNRKNQQNITYSYDYKETQPINGLPILPTFGIRGEF